MKTNTRVIALNGVLAALYAALTLATASFAYGPIQFRVADALCVLPYFAPSTSIGLFLGCLAANLFSPVSALDIVIGSAATLLGCLTAARVKKKWLVAMLACVYTPDALLEGFLTMGAQVAVGEIAVMAALGMPLLALLSKTGAVSRLLHENRTAAQPQGRQEP